VRLKTFLATYLLFLLLLFSSVAIVSVFMTTNQASMLADKNSGQYQAIIHSLRRDLTALHERQMDPTEFSAALSNLADGYERYYRGQNIQLSIYAVNIADLSSEEAVVSFGGNNQADYIYIIGTLTDSFGSFQIDYRVDITQDLKDMRNIQNVLLFSTVAFSLLAAIVLHFLLRSIFKPLALVAQSSKSIAGGHYSERIAIKGGGELARVAEDFNRMADRVEAQFDLLKSEAIRKQQFVDNFAHETRTPLTSIYGYAEYLQKTAQNEEEVIESAQHIMDEAKHLHSIADSLLKLATLRDYTPDVQAIEVSELFDDVAQTLKDTFNESGVKLICASEVGSLRGQRDLIKVLLLNLCTNALRACSADGGTVYLKVQKVNTGIALSVIDNGRGIAPEELAEITEPFYRIDKARSDECRGVGLGLTLSSHIVEAHGASLDIESSVGEGTKVTVTFTSPKHFDNSLFISAE
jgi:signal transduction histidine kinase